jgi:biopolymer transport protein ExbB/TolQ
VSFILFLKTLLMDIGILVFPIFIAFSMSFIIIFERFIYFSFVFRQEKTLGIIKDVIINNKFYPKQLREDLVDIELQGISKSLEFGFGMLKFIAGISTMLGLLGTVIGMIDVFSSIATIKTAVSPNVISSGIKKAMYTTAYGLGISIISLTACYIFENIASKIFNKISEYAVLLNATTEYERLSEISKKKSI